MEFRDWFFEQFPEDAQINDSYKNTDGEGLLQRFLRVFGLDLDENVIPFIENFTDIIDYQKCDDKFLPLIGMILGNPPSFGGEPALFRKVLAYAVAIYKVKGTEQAYRILLGILGLKIRILADLPLRRITYDDETNPTYDNGEPDYQYDSECQFCSNYRIAYSYSGDPDDIPDILAKAESAICFIEPINAHFGGWVKMISIEDDYTLPVTETDFNTGII
jgi:phage tail-like protein